jgi:uncharacterized protein (DUF2249 family)
MRVERPTPGAQVWEDGDHMAAESTSSHPAAVIYAPVLPPQVRHQMIVDVFEAIPVNYSALLINDHDPKPLIYQLRAERSDVFGFEYVESGPTDYVVRVTRLKP